MSNFKGIFQIVQNWSSLKKEVRNIESDKTFFCAIEDDFFKTGYFASVVGYDDEVFWRPSSSYGRMPNQKDDNVVSKMFFEQAPIIYLSSVAQNSIQ